MQLNSYKPNIAVETPSQKLDWSNKFYFNSLQHQFQPDTWVQLLELPSSFSFDEALLLCKLSADEWVAWIPDHGEAVLHTNQFCPIAQR